MNELNNERLENESVENYKKRRKYMKDYQKRTTFFKNESESNRLQRRLKTKFRATKKLKYIRKKYMYGNVNVSFAILNNINVIDYIKSKFSVKKENILDNKINVTI
jgi:hypothetical protein